MEYRAKAKGIRQSPRKVRLVVDLIRGRSVSDALVQLQFCQKKAARPVMKLLQSAIANAVNNFKADENTLFVKTIAVDEGPTIKRWTPRAFGRATPIRKRMSHISIALAEKEGAPVKKKAAAKPKTTAKKATKSKQSTPVKES